MTAKALETPDLAHRGKQKGLCQEEARERARAGRRQLPPAALGPPLRPQVPPRSWAFFARNRAADAARGGLLSPPSSVHLRFAARGSSELSGPFVTKCQCLETNREDPNSCAAPGLVPCSDRPWSRQLLRPPPPGISSRLLRLIPLISSMKRALILNMRTLSWVLA